MAQQQTGDLRHARTGIELRPGLDGVPATQSAICDIDGEKGLLTYRGYPMQDLAANSSFLETAYLLIWGELPSREQLAEFEHAVQMHRRVSFRVRDMMKCFPASGHPMDALQSSAASLGLFYSRRAIDDPQYIYDAVVRLIAKIPTMVAAFQLIRKGQDPIQPRDDLACGLLGCAPGALVLKKAGVIQLRRSAGQWQLKALLRPALLIDDLGCC